MKRTPLKRKKSLRSKQPLRSLGRIQRRHSPKQTREFSVDVRRTVKERSGGMCERCGSSPAVHLHHAVYRSQQGTNDVSNAIALCMDCHAAAHGKAGVRRWCVREAKRLAKGDGVIAAVENRTIQTRHLSAPGEVLRLSGV